MNDVASIVMTAEEACSQLGLTFRKWEILMWKFHMGVPVSREVGAERRKGGWMPTPIQGRAFGLLSRRAVYGLRDVVQLMCEQAWRRDLSPDVRVAQNT
jgi:hypothetical protein